jgi:peroxiredoxin
MNANQKILLPALLTVSMCSLLFLFGTDPLEAGSPAPDFTLPSINGEQISLDDFEGHPIVLIFWSSTSPPCLEELPDLEALEEEFAPQELAVVTINMDSSVEEALSALQETNVTLPTLLGNNSNVMRAYSVNATPTTYIIDGNGTIVVNKVGYGKGTEDYLHSEIQDLLEE